MLAGITSGWAQPVAFANYMAADGLSDNNALCSLRDRYVFVWIGYENGLGIYNPKTQLIDDYPAISLKQEINVLMADGNDLWIGTRRQGIRITEAAVRVGFTSSSYFARCFKNRFGVLPKDFVSR